MDESRLERIEEKLDKVSEAIVSLARMEERMLNLFRRMDAYDAVQYDTSARVSHLEQDVASGKWIEKSMWVIFTAVVAAIVAFFK